MSRGGTISVRAIWARLIAERLKQAGADAGATLAEARLTPRMIDDPESWIAFSAHAKLFDIAARELEDDCFGLNFAQTIEARDVGVLAYLGLASATLDDGLVNLARYSRVVSEAFDVRFRKEGDRGILDFALRDASLAPCAHATEFAVAAILHTYRRFSGRKLVPAFVHFMHQRRTGHAKFQMFFACPVKFGQPDGQMAFTSETLATPLPTSDNRLLAILRQHADDILAQRPARADGLPATVERRLSALLPRGEARAKIVAAELGLSERTLARRLDGFGTDFGTILDSLRHGLARRYLGQPDLSLTQIAFLLGYANQSAFSTAFRRWTGMAPREARAEMAAGG